MHNKQLRKIASDKLKTLNLEKATSTSILNMLGKYKVTGASVDNVVSVTKEMHDLEKDKLLFTVENILQENAQLINGKRSMRQIVGEEYDLSVLNTSIEAKQILEMTQNALDYAERHHFCVEFKPLEKSGIQTMLEKYFPEYGFTKDEIKNLEASGSITPGDFGSLSSRIRFMNQDKVNSSVITKELIDLQKEKKNGSFCQKMGF